jgi:hypothetical protein
MNYGLNGTYATSPNNGMNTGGDYFHSHYQHHHPKANATNFPNSSKSNGHHLLDEIDNEQQQQQQRIADDPDRPKLLMWGLTK